MNLLPASVLAGFLLSAGLVVAQQGTDAGRCNPWKFYPPSGAMSFEQKACLQLAALTRPGLALRAAAFAGLGVWHGGLHPSDGNHEGFMAHMGVFYARHAAKATGELLAEYLNHEDPRPRLSLEHGNWNRARSALLGVVRVKDADGHSRPAFAPVAGAFGSGMVGMVLSPNRNSLNSGFERTEVAYGTYFMTALVREFKPDLMGLAARMLRSKK